MKHCLIQIDQLTMSAPFLNKFKLGMDCRSFGRAFHAAGPATLIENLREFVRANIVLTRDGFLIKNIQADCLLYNAKRYRPTPVNLRTHPDTKCLPNTLQCRFT